MKCIGEKCKGYFESDGHTWCLEVDLPVWKDDECKLPDKIKEVRDDLLRRCSLFEDILDAECGESLDDEIDKMD